MNRTFSIWFRLLSDTGGAVEAIVKAVANRSFNQGLIVIFDILESLL